MSPRQILDVGKCYIQSVSCHLNLMSKSLNLRYKNKKIIELLIFAVCYVFDNGDYVLRKVSLKDIDCHCVL